MSRWWRDRIECFLAPSELRLRRGSGVEERLAVPGVADGPAWQSSLHAFAERIDQRGWRHADLRVTLSNHFVRLLAVAWKSELRSSAEALAYARHLYLDTFGEASRDWLITVPQGAPGAWIVTAATDQMLHDTLMVLARERDLRVTSLRPHLSAVIDGHRRELAGEVVWLVVAEAGRLCLARARHGAWDFATILRGGADPCRAVHRAVLREMAADTASQRGTVIHWSGAVTGDAGVLNESGWRVVRLVDAPAAVQVAA